MIKKYGFLAILPAILWVFCAFGAKELTKEQRIIDLLKILEQKISKTPRVNFQNALVNTAQANERMDNKPALELLDLGRKIVNAYSAYAKELAQKKSITSTKLFLEMVTKSNELLTLFLVGKSDPKDGQKPYRFVLSQIDDPAIAVPLDQISQETRDEIRRNYHFLVEHKNIAPHLIKRLKPLGTALG